MTRGNKRRNQRFCIE